MTVTAAPPQARPPLLAASWRAPALGLVALLAAAFVPLAVLVSGGTRANGFDRTVAVWLFDHLGTTAASMSLDATKIALLGTVLVGTVAVALLVGERRLAVLAAVAPVGAIALTEYVLKPIIGRRIGAPGQAALDPIDGFAFPSGHSAAVSALAGVLAVALLRSRLGRGATAAGLAVLAAWTLVGVVGLIRNLYHYASDTVGGVCVGLACVITAAAAIDLAAARIGRRRSG